MKENITLFFSGAFVAGIIAGIWTHFKVGFVIWLLAIFALAYSFLLFIEQF